MMHLRDTSDCIEDQSIVKNTEALRYKHSEKESELQGGR